MHTNAAAALLLALCAAAHASGAEALEHGGAEGRYQEAPHMPYVGDSGPQSHFSTGFWPGVGHAARKLLHGCHSKQGRSCNFLPNCPRCVFPVKNSSVGHCKKREGGNLKLFNCPRRTGTRVSGAPRSVTQSILGNLQCPTLHAASWPGHFINAPENPDEPGDYYYEPEFFVDVMAEEVLDYFAYDDYTPQFQAASTPSELRDALQRGTKHVVILEHLDMTASPTTPDLPEEFVALDNSISRVSNTTLSVSGRCQEPPPQGFALMEPVPPGACAILVREDFLDAPLGTTCLLLDSLYVARVAPPNSMRNSVLVLHVDGLMWITNSVFQGAGKRSTAIDTNTTNGGRPELYIQDTTFTGFRRSLSPGISLNRNAKMWLDNVAFRNITRTRDSRTRPEGSAVVAYNDTLLVMRDVEITGNTVLGAPAGVRAITVSRNRTEVYASPAVEVWPWPGGPAVMSAPGEGIADLLIDSIARPQLETIQTISQEIIDREFNRT